MSYFQNHFVCLLFLVAVFPLLVYRLGVCICDIIVRIIIYVYIKHYLCMDVFHLHCEFIVLLFAGYCSF